MARTRTNIQTSFTADAGHLGFHCHNCSECSHTTPTDSAVNISFINLSLLTLSVGVYQVHWSSSLFLLGPLVVQGPVLEPLVLVRDYQVLQEGLLVFYQKGYLGSIRRFFWSTGPPGSTRMSCRLGHNTGWSFSPPGRGVGHLS